MEIQGKEFAGSSSLFETQQLSQSVAGRAIWSTEFNPIKRENLNFIELLLHTLCMHSICCAISETFPTYVVGILSPYYVITLCIARTNSTVLDFILKKNVNRKQMGPFSFEFREENDDFMNCEITLGDISIPFEVVVIDTSKECGPRSNLNFVEFIWNRMVLLQFKKICNNCRTLETSKILYLKHHRATSEGWKTSLLCELIR